MRSSRTLPQYQSPTPRQKSRLPTPAHDHALNHEEQLSPLMEKLPPHSPSRDDEANNDRETTQLHTFIDNNEPYDDPEHEDSLHHHDKPLNPIYYMNSDSPEPTPDATPEPDTLREDSLAFSTPDQADEEDDDEEIPPQPVQESSEEEDDDGMDESKSEGEIEAINYDMQELTDHIPGLAESYKLIGRLGEGAFVLPLPLAQADVTPQGPSPPSTRLSISSTRTTSTPAGSRPQQPTKIPTRYRSLKPVEARSTSHSSASMSRVVQYESTTSSASSTNFGQFVVKRLFAVLTSSARAVGRRTLLSSSLRSDTTIRSSLSCRSIDIKISELVNSHYSFALADEYLTVVLPTRHDATPPLLLFLPLQSPRRNAQKSDNSPRRQARQLPLRRRNRSGDPLRLWTRAEYRRGRVLRMESGMLSFASWSRPRRVDGEG